MSDKILAEITINQITHGSFNKPSEAVKSDASPSIVYVATLRIGSKFLL
jgi:hypothetical protein